VRCPSGCALTGTVGAVPHRAGKGNRGFIGLESTTDTTQAEWGMENTDALSCGRQLIYLSPPDGGWRNYRV
jgi:hypothetical protein